MSDDQACLTACTRYVCLSRMLHRFPSPARLLGTTLPKPFDWILDPRRRARAHVIPDHGVLSAIENP